MCVCSRGEVFNVLCDIRAKLTLDRVNNLYIVPRDDKKNQNCMVELGLSHNDVADILVNLKDENYCETVPDDKFKGEWLWVFGYVYNDVELYIKVGVRAKVVCVSFHPKEFVIRYPYR